MTRRPASPRGDEGFSLPVVLFVVIVLASLGMALFTITISSHAVADMELGVDRAAYVARAGFERTCAEVLMVSDDWSVLDTEPFTDEPFGDGVYTAVLSGLSADECTVNVTALQDGREHTVAFLAERITSGSSMTWGGTSMGLAKGGPPSAMTICHSPGTPAEQTMTINASAWPSHQAHGDHEGPCSEGGGEEAEEGTPSSTTGVRIVAVFDPTMDILSR